MNAGLNCIVWSGNLEKPGFLPHVLCCVSRNDQSGEAALKLVYAETKLLTNGYIWTFVPHLKPRRHINPQAQLNMRRKRLRKQVEQNYPLFADEMEQRELAEKPEKFSLAKIAAQHKELAAMEEQNTSEFESAMNPQQALDFLRKTVVVPFVSEWVNQMNSQRQAFQARLTASKLNKGMKHEH